MSRIPNDFNWIEYLRLNQDLNQKSTEKDAIYHYINHGLKENRQYKNTIPNDFNWKIYLKLNKDINTTCSEEEIIKHYINFGLKENRKYKIDLPNNFDWKLYLQINQDFPKDWNEKEAKYHYTNYGYFEGRSYVYNINPTIIDYSNSQNDSCMSYDEVNSDVKLQLLNDYSLLDGKYTLIIDFPNLGGGTKFFIDTIISKYKKNQTFIIARNFNDMIQFNINNEYIFGNFEEHFAIDFINKSKKNIKKVFINHILKHSSSFIDFIMDLNIEITTITHDYTFINENPQPYFNEITYDKCKIDFKKVGKLIVQNEENIHVFKHFLSDKQNIIISPLPDFKKSLDIYYTNNDKIVIGIIGYIGLVKGQELLQNIIEHIKENNLNIKVIIFGCTNFDYEHKYPYKNIDELNNLLKIFKPNILFETSIWPETYSYTLTLSMLTQLPVLSFKKQFKNVIENRLKKYDKKFFYENMDDFFLLVNNLKQNYFYTIDPIIYFNSFWDEYFDSSENIVLSDNNNNNNETNTLSDHEKNLFNIF